MSQSTSTDPTLEALVPRGSAWRSAALVVLACAVLVGSWVLPAHLRPTINGGSESGTEFAAEGREVVLSSLAPQAWGGVTVTGVDDVRGAHVVAAWALEGSSTALSNLPASDAPSDQYVVERLGVTDADRLPRRLASGVPATLVVLWQVDNCGTAATANGTDVRISGPLGTARVEHLSGGPWFSQVWGNGTPCLS
jgi:hypothetical protein